MRLFESKSNVAVDIGSTHIKVTGIRQKDHVFQLIFYDVVDLTQEHQVNTFEELSSKDEYFLKTLQALVRKYNFKKQPVRGILPAEKARIQSLNVRVTDVNGSLEKAIRNELKKSWMEDLEDMNITFQVFDQDRSVEEGVSALACALPNAEVHRYHDMLSACQLKVPVLDLDAMAIYNAFYFEHGGHPSEPLAVISVGASYTVCVIMVPDKWPFIHAIRCGGNQITQKIMDEFGLPLFKAEHIKRLDPQIDPQALQPAAWEKLNGVFEQFTAQLAGEVRRCLRYFQTHEHLSEINKLYLTGGMARSRLFVEFFNAQLGVTTRIWNPLSVFVKKQQNNEQTRQLWGMHLAPSIGTLLRGD